MPSPFLQVEGVRIEAERACDCDCVNANAGSLVPSNGEYICWAVTVGDCDFLGVADDPCRKHVEPCITHYVVTPADTIFVTCNKMVSKQVSGVHTKM